MPRSVTLSLTPTRDALLTAAAAQRGLSPRDLLRQCVNGAVDALARPLVPPPHLFAPLTVLEGDDLDEVTVPLLTDETAASAAVVLAGPRLRDHGTLTQVDGVWTFVGLRSAVRLCALRFTA